ncbi:hypothetical protein GQ600_27615 [Phytophthora cactorum]|nr:hypothetical protein GQ600_27615 [Phytophthora cactorum]
MVLTDVYVLQLTFRPRKSWKKNNIHGCKVKSTDLTARPCGTAVILSSAADKEFLAVVSAHLCIQRHNNMSETYTQDRNLVKVVREAVSVLDRYRLEAIILFLLRVPTDCDNNTARHRFRIADVNEAATARFVEHHMNGYTYVYGQPWITCLLSDKLLMHVQFNVQSGPPMSFFNSSDSPQITSALVIATTLHASGCALPTTKDSNLATLANVESPVADGGRLLRGVNKGDELVQEERSTLRSSENSRRNTGRSSENGLCMATTCELRTLKEVGSSRENNRVLLYASNCCIDRMKMNTICSPQFLSFTVFISSCPRERV